ncbi:hypothetical protein A2U01_0117358, partial [Trifolium medium]|nr:hypothetical protein [Trifolium medium]
MKNDGGRNWIGNRNQDPRIYQIVATIPLIAIENVNFRNLQVRASWIYSMR